MPSGRTHDLITSGTSPVIGYFSYLVWGDIIVMGLITFFYLFSSLMFNGDLDIRSRPMNRWLILRWIWIPYQHFFDHRSIWTHGIIVGTIIRIIYIMPLLYLIYIIIPGSIINGIISFFDMNGYFVILYIFIGLELGNIVHTTSDKLFSSI